MSAQIVALRKPSEKADAEWEALVAWLVEKGYEPAFIRHACEQHALRVAAAARSAWGHDKKKDGLDPLLMA